MGQCCNRSDVGNNEELYFMELMISSLKISSEDGIKIEKKFNDYLEIKTIQDGNIEKQMIMLSEHLLNEFIEKNFYSSDSFLNPYKEFHKKLAPTFDEVTHDNIFEFNFHQYCLSLYQNNNKHELLYKLLTDHSYVDSISFSAFEKFIADYLKINLILLTEKINQVLHNTKENTMIDNYKINMDFRVKSDQLEQNVFNEYNVSLYKEEVIKIMKKIIQKYPNEKIDFTNVLITQVHLKTFVEGNPNLFDCLKLRDHFYDKVVERR
jgi:hypothetical protein